MSLSPHCDRFSRWPDREVAGNRPDRQTDRGEEGITSHVVVNGRGLKRLGRGLFPVTKG